MTTISPALDSSASKVEHIPYGRGTVPLVLRSDIAEWQVIRQRPEPALTGAQQTFARAANDPIGAKPLRDIAKPGDRVVIVTCDGTRPVPNALLVPWILEELNVSPEDVTVLLGTGTHRPNTPEEIRAMFGPIDSRVRIVNHNAFDAASNLPVGTNSEGFVATLARLYVEADVRICLGFIEPHFFAGFSGGAKGIMPGIAGIETILNFHNFARIAHPRSAYGILDNNPTQDMVREVVGMCPPDFLVNVTLNSAKEITAFFLGDYIKAHDAGCEHVRKHAMFNAGRKFPIVITSNTGYPLDQNLYQSVKALAAAEPILEDGGTVFLVSECSDGMPAHGNFASLLGQGAGMGELLEQLRNRAETALDQWQVQTLLRTAMRCKISLHSTLSDGQSRDAYMDPVEDLQTAVEARIAEITGRTGEKPHVAVMTEGPLTIPYVG